MLNTTAARALIAGLALFCLSWLSPAMAQTVPVTLDFKDAELKTVMSSIEKQTTYLFLYDPDFDFSLKVTVKVSRQPLSVVLKQVFDGTPFAYEVSGSNILLSMKVSSAKVVKGTVLDEKGEPFIGAMVLVKGTSIGVTTDLDGQYSLSIPAGASSDMLELSCLGYDTQTVPIAGRQIIDFKLQASAINLNESVVVGYGVQKKLNLTGAVSVVDGDALTSRSSASVTDILKGVLPNVNITGGSRPGDAATVNIRGVTSIASTTGPLILIDGVEGDLRDVNPADVESISVLKDASASSVYGARAGFGVILITTKMAKADHLQVSYNGKFSVSTPTVSTDFETRGYYSAYINDMFFRTYQGVNYTTYTAEDYQELWARRNDKVEDPSRPWVVEKNGQYKYYGNFDWYNYLYDDRRPTHEHNVSVQGGTENVKFFLSGNFYNQRGVNAISPDSFTHYSFRSKIDANVTKWLTISNNTSFSYRKQDAPGSSIDFNEYFKSTHNHALASIVPINPDGTFVYKSSTNPTYGVADGIAAIAENGKHRMWKTDEDLRTTFEVVIKPVKQFELRANYSYTNLKTHDFIRIVDVPFSTIPGKIEYLSNYTDNGEDRLLENDLVTRRHVVNAYGTYHDTFADKHDLTIMAGMNCEQKRYKKLREYQYDLLSEEISDFNIAVGDNMKITGGNYGYAILGFFYRANYSYADRYLVELSGRYDGSSRFAKDHRFGFFPSFSLGWRISEEKFFEPIKSVVNNLKLRYSYGSLGNQSAVGYLDYIQSISTSNQLAYAFGDNARAFYATESAPNATDISWEKIYTNNIGLDLSMFNGRLNASLDGYIRDTKDMIMQSQALPASYGANPPKANSADLRTYGFEFSISWNDHFKLGGEEFYYGVNFGLGDSQSFITKYDNPTCNLSSPYVGQRLGDIWGFRTDGLFATDLEAANWEVDQTIVNNMINTEVVDTGLHAGDLKYRGLDGNKVLERTLSANDPKDTEVIGNSLPRYNYNAGINLSWYGVDLSIMFQGIGHQDCYPGTEAHLFWGPYSRPYSTFIPSNFMSNVWSEENPDAYFPRPRGYVALFDNRELGAINDRYLQNVAYCRLKNLTLGYSLPSHLLKKAKISKIRFYFSGENLLTISPLKTKYIDPEQAAAGLSWRSCRGMSASYPYARTFTFGLDITL